MELEITQKEITTEYGDVVPAFFATSPLGREVQLVYIMPRCPKCNKTWGLNLETGRPLKEQDFVCKSCQRKENEENENGNVDDENIGGKLNGGERESRGD